MDLLEEVTDKMCVRASLVLPSVLALPAAHMEHSTYARSNGARPVPETPPPRLSVCRHRGYFVDLFVRVSNSVAIGMYEQVRRCSHREELLQCITW